MLFYYGLSNMPKASSEPQWDLLYGLFLALHTIIALVVAAFSAAVVVFGLQNDKGAICVTLGGIFTFLFMLATTFALSRTSRCFLSYYRKKRLMRSVKRHGVTDKLRKQLEKDTYLQEFYNANLRESESR